ncbi:centrosomal protein of 85 kDa [Protopterus annectens]|uniref:centrosomal protein of 85 kDa n=1 Tax=Protopterus annectens TaxID=7888 RepID=UPI001CF95255|nr:centrosomal protein of 85 kDa [Protopterus annectens]
MSNPVRCQDVREQNENDSNTVYNGFRPDTEWQTPVMSDKPKNRCSRRQNVEDSGDTVVGTSCSNSSEDLCGSSGSTFQPIKTQVIIPTAHVLPSTMNTHLQMQTVSETCHGSASLSCEIKDFSAVSAVPEMHPSASNSKNTGNENTCNVRTLPELHNFCRTGNYLDYSLFRTADQSKLDDFKKFDTPTIEPTLNQSALLETIYSDPSYRMHLCREDVPLEMKENCNTFNQTYKVLPETKPIHTAGKSSGQQMGFQPTACNAMQLGIQPCGALSTSPTHQSATWLQDKVLVKPEVRQPDIGTWQQQQDIDTIRHQMKQLQMFYGVHTPAPVYPSLLHQDSYKWEFLKEKERVIERQTQQISNLERKLWERDLQVHSALSGPANPYGDIVLLKLQESQREAMFLRAQFADLRDSFSKEKKELDRKLGDAELEVQQLKSSIKDMTEKHSEELKKQEERVKGREKYISSLKKKMQKELDQNREKQQRIETLERYLADLPTLEDYQKQTEQVKELEMQKVRLQERVGELEGNLADAQSLCQKTFSQLETQKRKERELTSAMHSLQEKINRTFTDGATDTAAEMEKLRSEKCSLKEECDRTKKVVEKQQKRMEFLLSQVRSHEQRIVQEEGAMQALREEVLEKEKGLQQLRTAVKELSVQNQDLMEKNLTLQEQLTQSCQRMSLSRETFQLTQKLHTEMFTCLRHLQSVCKILMQRTQGKDPNLSLLLGMQSMQSSTEDDGNWQSPELLKKKLSEVQQLHTDIEELRTTISDHYAQDVGENCITQ